MMSLLTTASNILHYGVAGEIDYIWGFALFAIGALGGGSKYFHLLSYATSYIYLVSLLLFYSIYLTMFQIIRYR